MKKEFNKFKAIKITLLLISLYIIIMKPMLIINGFTNITTYVMTLSSNGTLSYIMMLQIIIAIFIIGAIIKALFGKWYHREKLKHTNMKKNTYSKGHARFQKVKEGKECFTYVEYGEHNTDGFLVAQYKELKMPWFKTKYYPFYETKVKTDNGNEELSNIDQIKILQNNIKKISLKQKIHKLLAIKEKTIMFIDTNPIHELIIATTRAGKTQTLVIPQIDYLSSIKEKKNKPHMVISDPKGELFENTAKDVEARGYEVMVINMKDFFKSHSFNPLDRIKDKFDEEFKEGNFDYEQVNQRILASISDLMEELTQDEEMNGKYHGLINSIDDIISVVEIKLANKDIKGIVNYFDNDLKIERRMFDIEEEIEQEYINELEKSCTFAFSETEIDKFVTALIPTPDKDPQWTEGAKKIFASYIKFTWEQAFIYNRIDEGFNIYSVLVEINKGGTNISNNPNIKKTRYQKKMELRGNTSYARQKHGPVFFDNPYDSYMSNLLVALGVFQNENVGKLLSKNQFDFHKIVKGEKPYAIYLITPDYEKTYNFIVSTFISQLYLTAVEDAEKYYNGKLPRKLHFILDEFANIPKITDLTSKITVCLGRGIQFLFVIQNKQQLVSVYGEDDATTILDNTHNKMFLLAGDSETREWFSNQLGKTTILTQSYSGKDIDEMSMTTQEEEKSLVSAYDLNLNPLGQVYGSIVKQHPIKFNLRPAFQYLQINKTSEDEFFATHTNLHSNIKKEDIVI